MSEQNLDELMRMRNEALRRGVGSKPWIDFATVMLDSLPVLYGTGKEANNIFQKQAKRIRELEEENKRLKASECQV